MTLNDVYEQIKVCQKCNLHKNRIKPVLYRGNKNAKILILAEGPGKDENELGLPFVGRSGRLLDKLLKKVNLTEEDIYITNTVRCRPPNNRKPFYDEILACSPYFLKEIEIINPTLIITLGRTAGDFLFNYKPYEINKFHPDKKILPLYHPSYLLRRRSEIIPFLEALQKTLKELELWKSQ